ncbi:putative diphthamide synthesis protein-domain-containing protein, partial [Hyaloraphidium curvatum]
QVALQLPDELLHCATALAGELQKRTGRSVHVLGDTSYGSCCVDDVAAEHASCDIIVHCGRCCLSSAPKVPVAYALPREDLDRGNLIDAVLAFLDGRPSHLFVAFDVPFVHHGAQLISELRLRGINAVALQLLFPTSTLGSFARLPAGATVLAGCGRWHEGTEGSGDRKVLFVGNHGPALVRVALEFHGEQVFQYDPSDGAVRSVAASKNRLLARRCYAFMDKIRDANSVGIVIAALSLDGLKPLLGELKRALESAGKRTYELVVGKINVAKLANFPDMDAFVLVGCPETTIVDSKDFLRPIVTPFEALRALSPPDAPWNGEYLLNPGGLVGLAKEARKLDDDEDGITLSPTEVIQKAGSNALTRVLDGAAVHLSARSFRGLDVDDSQPPAIVRAGKMGIATSYDAAAL